MHHGREGRRLLAHPVPLVCPLLHQFIYDTWYCALTPDREFPAEVRRILNSAFGRLAARGRRLDLREMLNDVCELLMEQVRADEGWAG